MLRRTRVIILIVAIAIIGSAAFLNLYYLRDDNAGQILWKSNEAYLCMGIVRRGFRVRLAEYPWIALQEWLNVPAFPSDRRAFLTIIRVTPLGVDRHIGKVSGDPAEIPDLLTPLGETIYANCQGTLCKWAGTHFETATRAEQERLDGTTRLVADIDTTVNGWSKRGIGTVAGNAEYSIDLGKEFTLRVRQGNVYKAGELYSAVVELHHSGDPPQQLWHVSTEPRRVTKREYERGLSTLEDK